MMETTFMLREELVEEATDAWIAVSLFMERKRVEMRRRNKKKSKAGPRAKRRNETCPLDTFEVVLARHGIHFDDDRLLWQAYEREVRARGYARLDRIAPRPARSWKRSKTAEREDIVRMFGRGVSRKQIAREKGRSYDFVARVIREASDDEGQAAA